MLKYYALTQKASGKAIYLFHAHTLLSYRSPHIDESSVWRDHFIFHYNIMWVQMKGTFILRSRMSQGKVEKDAVDGEEIKRQ